MDDKIRQKMQELFVAYTNSLPAKMQDIETQWEALCRHWEVNALKNFHRYIHSLCGSAGTYGFPEIGASAREMELYLKNMLDVTEITSLQQEKIKEYIQKLKTTFITSLTKNPPVFENKPLEPTENKLIYLVEEDGELVNRLCQNLEEIGYRTQRIKDLALLQITLKEKSPLAIIIDTDYLEKANFSLLQNALQESVQVFCIVPNADLLPRLMAIRFGCHAIFQKPVDIFFLIKILNQKSNLLIEEPHRILIIDDSESLAEYYACILNQVGMDAQYITNPLELLKKIETFHPNLLLMDIYMPECTGLELAAILRLESNYTKIPIIFLSTEEDKLKQLSAISIGCDDFLTKPISPQHLISAVKSRSKRGNILNAYMSTDTLTELYNHTTILNRLERELDEAKQKNLPLSFIMVDIDHFKKINDSYGHQIGDVVIKKLASLLSTRLRSQDIVGRYGGEEFAIILPEANALQSKKICNALREQFSQYNFTAESQGFSVTFSAGISEFKDHCSGKKLVEEADLALYKAKQIGRDKIVIFRED